jgi:hypothetical protein
MGRKMVRFAALSGTRSRQDESIEVGEVGSKRPSLGCNGVHVVRWIGLIFRLLGFRLPQKYGFPDPALRSCRIPPCAASDFRDDLGEMFFSVPRLTS